MTGSRTIKIGIGHPNPTPGKFKQNTHHLKVMMKTTWDQRCDFVATGEGSLTGYLLKDFITYPQFHRSELKYMRELVDYSAKLVGTLFMVGGTILDNGVPGNVVFLFGNGQVYGISKKFYPPNDGLFEEGRNFSRQGAGEAHQITLWDDHPPVWIGDLIFKLPFLTFALQVCEDTFTQLLSVRQIAYGAAALFNNSASPWRMGVTETRQNLVLNPALAGCMVVYTSIGGAQDGVVFDGDGYAALGNNLFIIADRNRGSKTCFRVGCDYGVMSLDALNAIRAANVTMWNQMADALAMKLPPPHVVEIPWDYELRDELPSPYLPRRILSPDDQKWDIIAAMVTSVLNYVIDAGMDGIGNNISGGWDSLLTAIISMLVGYEYFDNIPEEKRAAEVYKFVQNYSWPTNHNSPDTMSMAREICETLGLYFQEESIQTLFEAQWQMVESSVKGRWKDDEAKKIAKQSVQALIRMSLLDPICRAQNLLMIGNSNRSEKGSGFGNKRADMEWDFGPIVDLTKTQEEDLLLFLGEQLHLAFMDRALRIEPSAELEEGQKDAHSLPPYSVLDEHNDMAFGMRLDSLLVYHMLRAKFPQYPQKNLKDWTIKSYQRFFRNVHKWVTSAAGTHIQDLDFNSENTNRYPINSGTDWLDTEVIENDPN